MSIKDSLQSKTAFKILYIVGVLALILIIFQAGVFVGYRKAAFSYRFGDRYYNNIRGPGNHFLGGFPRGGFPDASGATGKVMKIDLPTIIVLGPDNIEKVVRIDEETKINRFRDSVSSSEIRVNDFVTIIGNPNSRAEIEARLVRIIPPFEKPIDATSKPR